MNHTQVVVRYEIHREVPHLASSNFSSAAGVLHKEPSVCSLQFVSIAPVHFACMCLLHKLFLREQIDYDIKIRTYIYRESTKIMTLTIHAIPGQHRVLFNAIPEQQCR